ncbi:MAG: hypothetical protein NW224_02785 [Leptolyngbyaceae cyanobacterium bins.302]|nr:hypothetical protein [Leptolyngbyaceae cyanobacterium bins.302]
MRRPFATAVLILAIAPVLSLSWLAMGGNQAAIAQIIRTEGVGRRVYEQLPDFPRENQYINKETGKVSEDETLVNRLVRYHVYVKGRPAFYRLDWKLTLAEYLGLSGQMDDSDYPGAARLNKNPLEGDIVAIRKLNLAQRNALVQALVDAFSPQTRPPQAVPKPVIQLPAGGKP